MIANNYQSLAMRTYDGKSTHRLYDAIVKYDNTFKLVPGVRNSDQRFDVGGALNAAAGICGEGGELIDLIKKMIFHEKDIDLDHLKKELGDVCWYVAQMCEAMGWNLDDVMTVNVLKLEARYPDGFDVEKANHRKEGDV